MSGRTVVSPEKASQKVAEFNHIVWAELALLVLGIFAWRWFKRRRKQAAEAHAAKGPGLRVADDGEAPRARRAA